MSENNMLEHQKIVLKGVSNDRNLFSKELNKSFTWLSKYELKQLVNWLQENFTLLYQEFISDKMLIKIESK